MKKFHLHLVSDATGETLISVAKAVLVQFKDAQPVQHLWSMIRNETSLKQAIDMIRENHGIVLYTILDRRLRSLLERECRAAKVPCVAVLDPTMRAIADFFGSKELGEPGIQHALDSEYFQRIEAMSFTLAHDDGQGSEDLAEADVILLGVSRTSKTPTSIYLANRGLKVANIPLVPGVPLPESLFKVQKPMVVGLVASAERLMQIRRQRMLSLKAGLDGDYVDLDAIRREIREARRLCARHGWPVIDVSRRSIEETAAEIINLYQRRRGE